ncbi:type 2 lanthipeptide synthetase LanM [Nostoc sp. CALU 546]|uniref:type 2 lanthipeptide synthetase LanM n=1 Tax=Nostoc sp. CALU 546 TaxID=1867241 RepID=UPI003B67A62D
MKLTIDIWARLSKEQQERLQQIIARAVPSHERTMSEFFLPRSPVNQARIEKLTQQWQKAITNDAPEKFDIYLQTQNLTHNAQIKTSVSQSTIINQNYFPAKFVEVLIKNPQELPEWANALVELISLAILPEEQVKQSDNISDNQQIPYHQVIEPFLQGAKLTLQQCIATSGLTVSAAGLTDMLAVFANRLWHLVGSVVDFELHLLAANTGLLNNLGAKSQPILDGDVTSWLDRFERFPVLAYLVAVSYMNWRGWMTEICQRLAADRELLCTQLFRGMQLGQLTGFQGDAGDVHAQGRTVAILTFASGNKVVYKPKDLRCAAAFINLVTDLNQSGLEPQLHVRSILTRGNYTWEEFVEYKPCQNSQEVQRFYMRMGMTIRLLQLLEGRDFWLDNLVAHGEYPVFIDLETILQPRATPTNLLPAEQVARQMLAESVVETCIIAMPTPIEMGIKAEDFGALAMPGEFITPYKRPTASRHNGNRLNEQDYFTWSHTQHAPVLDNNPVDAAEYLQEILAGYKLMQECLQTNQTALLAADSPLVYLSNVPVRFIYRDTWTYHKLIRSSLTPTLLVDPIQREIFFQQLLGPVFTQELETESRNQHCQIVESEIAALLRLDIPFFTSRPNSNAVFTLEGNEVAGYFDDTSWNCLQQRLHCLNKFPLEQQMDLIRSCLATSRPHVDLQVTERNMKSAVVENSWISEAIALGSSILADSVTSSANDLAWLGLVYHPHMDLLSLEVLQSDLLTGTCGLAILFCDLYTITGQASWKDAARGALAATLKSVNHISEAWQEPEWSDRIQRNPYCGAFLGVGAQIFCLRYCAQALTAPELDKIANTCIQNLPLETLITHPSCDFVSGLSGLMLSVVSSTEGLEIGIKLITHLLDIRTKNGELPPPLYPHPSLWMNSFPDATAVLTMGLAKLLKHEHRMAPRFQHELESLLYAQLQNYPGVRHSPGHLLANLDIIQSTRIDAEQVLRKIDEYLAVERLATDTVGLLDDLEVAITAFQVTGKDKYLQHAFSSAEQIKTIRESYGSWFPRSFAADRHNLSVVWGVTAIARAFLRLHSPSVFTSIRIVGNPNFS